MLQYSRIIFHQIIPEYIVFKSFFEKVKNMNDSKNYTFTKDATKSSLQLENDRHACEN